MLDIPGLNKANYTNCVIWNATTGNVTAVGLNGGPSYFGTYDQGGNVYEWVENSVSFSGYQGSGIYSESRLVMGGSFKSSSGELTILHTKNNVGIHDENNYNSFTLKNDIGFRVASINNPLNLPNFVNVSGTEPLSFHNQSECFGITEENLFFSIYPERSTSAMIFTTGLLYSSGNCNALAHDYDRSLLFFMYDGKGASNVSGLYSWNFSASNPAMPRITNATNYITTSIGNADYYASGYWYFTEGTNVLNKVLFSFDNNNIPTATGKITWNINLPFSNSVNKFGDIAINKNNGKLYACVSQNNFYIVDLLPTTTGGSPVFIDNTTLNGEGSPALLQLAFNHDGTVLYGHHRDRKKWYLINNDNYSQNFGEIKELKTTDGLSTFLTPEFRDITGNSSFAIRGLNNTVKINALEVTNNQYVNFLNAVDPNATYASTGNYYNQYNQLSSPSSWYLYHDIMSNTIDGGIGYDFNNPTGLKYSVLENMGNKPVNYITAPMAMKYCNWLHNKVDDPNTTNTNTGAYTIPSIDSDEINTLQRSPVARYFLPSRREWISAGYYSRNKLNTQSWTYSNDNPWGVVSVLPVVGEPDVKTGWKIKTGNIWSTVTNVSPPNVGGGFENYWAVSFSPGALDTDGDGAENPGLYTFYSNIPSGYYLYSTQSDSPPSCSDIDPQGNGPSPQTVGVLANFTNLIPGTKYTAYFSLSENSPYIATINNSVVSFVASSKTEQIMVQVVKYWPMKILILNSKLIANDSYPNIHSENNIVVKCDHLDNGCAMTRTPAPTRTQTKTPTPSVTITPSASRPSGPQPPTPPSAPTNVVTLAGNAQVTTSWTAPTNNGGASITNYNIQYSTNNGAIWIDVLGDGPGLTKIVTGLTNDVNYIFRVAGINSAGTGIYSANSSVAKPFGSNSAPSVPLDLVATAAINSANLTWTAPTNNGGATITDYIIEYKLNGGSTWTIFSDGLNALTTTTVTGLTAGSTYVFRVGAKNSVGTTYSAESNSVTILSAPTVPTAPTNIVASAGNSVAILSWTSPSSDGGSPITSYEVQYSVNNGSSWTSLVGAFTSPANILSLANGTTYVFRVRAVNSVGPGPYSANSNSVIPVSSSNVPGIPTNVVPTAMKAAIQLNWSAPTSDGGSPITDYIIEYTTVGSSVWLVYPDGVGNITNKLISGLSSTFSYSFRIKAVNTNGAGDFSPQTDPYVQPLPLSVPGPVTGLNATSSDKTVSLSWNVPSDDGGTSITGYLVRYKPTSGFTWSNRTATSLNDTISGLTNGTEYEFTVQATNSIGNSSTVLTLATPIGPTIGPNYSLSNNPQAPSNFVMTSHNRSAYLTWKRPINENFNTYYVNNYTIGIYRGKSTNSDINDSDFLEAIDASVLDQILPGFNDFRWLPEKNWSIHIRSSILNYSSPLPLFIRLFAGYGNSNRTFDKNVDPRNLTNFVNAGWYKYIQQDTDDPLGPQITSYLVGDSQIYIDWNVPAKLWQKWWYYGTSWINDSNPVTAYIVSMYNNNDIYIKSQVFSSTATQATITLGAYPPGTYKFIVSACYQNINNSFNFSSSSDPLSLLSTFIVPSRTITATINSNF